MCSGLFFFVGLYTLIKGRLRLPGQNREVTGERARLLGVVLMLPVSVTLLAGLLYIFVRRGELTLDDQFGLAAFELMLVILAGLAALYLVLSAPPAPAIEAERASETTPKVLTVPEAAQFLRVSEDDVLQLINDGKLAAARIGGEYRIARQAVEDLLSGG